MPVLQKQVTMVRALSQIFILREKLLPEDDSIENYLPRWIRILDKLIAQAQHENEKKDNFKRKSNQQKLVDYS